ESLCYSNKVEDQWALNFNVPDEVNIESFKGEISFLYSLKTILGQALDSLNSGRFESSEEAVSAFYPAILAYSELPGFEKEKEALGKEIEKIIPSLYTYQKEDGGWAWIQKGDSDPYITAYVLEALITAAQKGCFVDKERLNSGMTYLKNRIANERNPAVKVYLLRTVSMVDNSYKPLALDLFEKRNELNYCTQAILAVILQRYGEQDKAKKIIDELMAQAVKTPRSTYWESSSEKLTWTDDSIYTNAWIAYAVNLITPDSSEINKILNWLVERKKDPGWSNTKTTSRACLFLMEYLKNHPEKESAGTASVYLNKTLIAKVNLNTEKNNNRAIVEIPFEKLSPGSNTLNLIRENGSPFFATVNLTKYQPARDKVEKKDQGFTIVVQYFKRIMEYDQNGKIKYRYENLDGNIKSGDVVLAVCKVVTWNSSPFLKVEIPVPGGFENLVDEEVEGIYPSDYKFDYKYKKFVRDQKVVFYQDACYPRMYIYPILLRANLPGEYYVNPAAARLIYYEEVKGNSESRIVKINPGK
ncbi:MAG: hypothetical protein M1536_01610, partial [Firmicutes bacterium]|nr:hypothetical protein [Bacillota bacterium]